MRAAQKRSSGRALVKAGLGYSGFQSSGGSTRPRCGRARGSRVGHLDPRADVEAEREHRDERRPRFPEELVAGARALRLRRAAAERRSEVEQVMADDRAAAGADERVEAVDAARVVVVQPGAEDEQPAQLAAMLVREDVVRVVRPRAVVAERSHGLALERLAGQDPVAAVGVARRRASAGSRDPALSI